MIDKIAYELVKHLSENVGFIDKWAGLVKPMRKQVQKVEKVFPVAINTPSACDLSDYTALVPDNSKMSVVYAEIVSAPTVEVMRHTSKQMAATIRLVVWYNLDLITAGGYISSDSVVDQIFEHLPKRLPDSAFTGVKQVHFQPVSITTGAEVVSQYTYNEVKTQFTTHPYGIFAIDIDVWYITTHCQLPFGNEEGCVSGKGGHEDYEPEEEPEPEPEPVVSAPEISNIVVTNVTESSYRVSATVNPNNASTVVSFIHIVDETIMTGSPATVTSNVTTIKTGLQPSTTYSFRIKAVNSAGTTLSALQYVTTEAAEVIPDEGEPIISLQDSTWIDHSFRFMASADVNPANAETTVKIEYGKTTAYELTDIELDALPSGSEDVAVTGYFPRLAPGVYHYRFVAENSTGVTVGSDKTFEVYTGTNRYRTTYVYPTFNSNRYYIDPDSVSNGAGTEADPFNTFPSAIGNGYSYFLKSGTEIEYAGEFVDVGTCEIGSYGVGAMPVIRCTQEDSDDNFKFIIIESLVYLHDIKFDKPDITGLNLYFRTGASDSFVKGIETEGWRYPVYTEATDFATQWDGLTIVYSTIHDCGFDGIVNRYCSQIEIAHNYIYNVNLQFNVAGSENQLLSPGDCIQCNSGGHQVISVHHNTLDHSTTGNKFCLIVASADATLGCHHNHMIGTHDYDVDEHPVSAIYLGGSGINIYNNLIENCNYGLYCYADNAKFNYNIVLNATIGVQVMDNHSCSVNNNLFIDYSVAGITKLSGASLTARNNVFKSDQIAIHLLSGGTVVNDHNHFDGCDASGTDYTTGDSLFTDESVFDYTPAALSPLLESGVDVGLGSDFADVVIVEPINKGVYQ